PRAPGGPRHHGVGAGAPRSAAAPCSRRLASALLPPPGSRPAPPPCSRPAPALLPPGRSVLSGFRGSEASETGSVPRNPLAGRLTGEQVRDGRGNVPVGAATRRRRQVVGRSRAR